MEEVALQDERFLNFVAKRKAVVDRSATHSKVNLFPIAKYQDVLTKLHEFSKSQDAIAILTGALSSGKTTLLKTFQMETQKTCEFVQGFSKLNIMQLLSHNQTNDEDSPQDEMTTDTVWSMINATKEERIFIIDDADYLSMESLQALIVAFSKQITGQLKLILLGEAILLKRIEMVTERNNLFNNLLSFNLAPLTLNETHSYIKHHVCPSLPLGKFLLSKKHLHKLYSLSEGYLGRINRVALQLELEIEKKRGYAPAKKAKLPLADLFVSIGIVVLLTLIGIKVFFIFNEQATAPPVVTKIITKPRSVPTHVVVKPLARRRPEVIFEEANTPCYIAPIEWQPEERLEKKIIPTKEVPIVNGKKKVGYTLQLMAVQNKQTLMKWLHQPANRFYMSHDVRIKMNRQNWYVLTYGHYASAKEAKDALSGMPGEIKSKKPWVRSLATLK